MASVARVVGVVTHAQQRAACEMAEVYESSSQDKQAANTIAAHHYSRQRL